jgi:hypothetical protein
MSLLYIRCDFSFASYFSLEFADLYRLFEESVARRRKTCKPLERMCFWITCLLVSCHCCLELIYCLILECEDFLGVTVNCHSVALGRELYVRGDSSRCVTVTIKNQHSSVTQLYFQK